MMEREAVLTQDQRRLHLERDFPGPTCGTGLGTIANPYDSRIAFH